MKTQITTTDIAAFGDTFGVHAYDADGREYTLLREDGGLLELPTAMRARRLEDRVKAAGFINAELWACRAPYGTDAWLLDGEEERTIEDERFGFM